VRRNKLELQFDDHNAADIAWGVIENEKKKMMYDGRMNDGYLPGSFRDTFVEAVYKAWTTKLRGKEYSQAELVRSGRLDKMEERLLRALRSRVEAELCAARAMPHDLKNAIEHNPEHADQNEAEEADQPWLTKPLVKSLLKNLLGADSKLAGELEQDFVSAKEAEDRTIYVWVETEECSRAEAEAVDEFDRARVPPEPSKDEDEFDSLTLRFKLVDPPSGAGGADIAKIEGKDTERRFGANGKVRDVFAYVHQRIFPRKEVEFFLGNKSDSTASDDELEWNLYDAIWEDVADWDSVRKVRFKCSWKDQGWGGQKGNLFVMDVDASWRKINNEVAPHSEAPLEIEIEADTIVKPPRFAYRVGGGGGHEITFVDAVVTLEMRASGIKEENFAGKRQGGGEGGGGRGGGGLV
jgi:hypothetical protein